jgi:leucyl aminopeptidase
VTYTPERNGSSLKACWLGGKRNHDTGGLNIKTAGMVHMKCDMAGGAAVFGLCNLLLICNYRKVTAIVPCAENAVDAKAFCQAI